MPYTLHNGDALDVLPTLPTASVDALILDPPSGIGFMSEKWDHNRGGRDAWVAWLASVLREARRTLKPGHYGLVWALPRTSHWTGWALEEAGFEVREKISHIFGSGFPKHANALKPAVENWWLVRNPGPAQALNVEALRVTVPEGDKKSQGGRMEHQPNGKQHDGWGMTRTGNNNDGTGRRAAHLVLQHSPACNGVCVEGCAVQALGAMSGERVSGAFRNTTQKARANIAKGAERARVRIDREASSGTAARFFTQFRPDADDFAPFIYAAKASRREKNLGCEGLPVKSEVDHNLLTCDFRTDERSPNGGYENKPAPPQANHHKTVKNQALMRWLVTLITPPNGTVLDCFMGSGSTGVAAVSLGHDFIGIEQNAEYIAIAEARLRHAMGPLFTEASECAPLPTH